MSRPAAGEDRLGRRAVACRPRDQAGPRRGRRDADARVRRGRRRDRRTHRRPGRPEPVGARAQPPGAVSPTCRRSRPMPMPTSGSRSGSATVGRSPRSSGSIARAGSSSSRRCSAGGRAGRRRSPRRASSSTRRGVARPLVRRSEAATGTPARRASTGHRGLPDLPRANAASPRHDSRLPRRPPRFRDARGTARDWAASRTPRPLPRRAHPARPAPDPGLAPTSLRRRAAAIKGFYRFAFGEGLIGIDVAAHLDLPRMPRLLPETLTQAEVERLLAAPGATRTPARAPRAALLELLYAAGLRISEALRLDLEDLSLDGAFVRVIGKGDRERLVPWARWRSTRSGAWLAGPARGARARPRGAGSRRPGVPRTERPAPRAPAGLGDREARRRRGRVSRAGSARTPCGTRSPPTCSRAAPTCASFRNCSDMRASAPRSSTPT